MPSRLYFFLVPLLLIYVPALLSIIRRSEGVSRFQMFFVVVAASSMVFAALGMAAQMAASMAYAMIPGTASGGGYTGEHYYFYSIKQDLTTPVDKETWERAFLAEQAAGHLVFVSYASFALSLFVLWATRRYFLLEPETEPERYRPPLRLRFRLKAPIAPVLCVMAAFLVGDFILTMVLADLGANPAAAHMLLLIATIFLGAIALMVTQRSTAMIVPGGLLVAYIATRMVSNLISGSNVAFEGAPFALDLFIALVFVALLFAASYKLVSKWTELPNRWR